MVRMAASWLTGKQVPMNIMDSFDYCTAKACMHAKACLKIPWHRELIISSDCIAGSGKTHTMIGDVSSEQDKGLLARVVNEIAVGVAGCTDDCYFQAHTSSA